MCWILLLLYCDGSLRTEEEGGMGPDIIFIPLGGGQRVGASCYYLRIGEASILLDAGIGMEDGMESGPDFHFLLTSPFVQSMNQISQIFISHAHADHVGYLLKLMKQTGHASVYMTQITKILAEYQLYDRLFIGSRNRDEDARLAAKSLLEKVATVSFMQTMDFGTYKVTFFPAGHIPGAMMVLFEAGRRKILYTGDYSLNQTALTSGCMIPENLRPDTVILCGLHARHPEYSRKTDTLFHKADRVLRFVEQSGQSALCQIPQLSKGIEFLKVLNEWNTTGICIYLDRSVMRMVAKMEQLSVPVLSPYNKLMEAEAPLEPHIYLTAGYSGMYSRGYKKFRIDFSLHEDFQEMKTFLKKVNPKQAVVVHCAQPRSAADITIEQEMMYDGECRTQFIFAEDREIYKI